MDEKSIWKKEISFKRKPKAPKAPKAAAKVAAAPADQPKSVWKKEISFKRKPKTKVAAAKAQGDAKTPIWRREITLGRKPAVSDSAVSGPDPGMSETAESWESPPEVPAAPIEVPPASMTVEVPAPVEVPSPVEVAPVPVEMAPVPVEVPPVPVEVPPVPVEVPPLPVEIPAATVELPTAPMPVPPTVVESEAPVVHPPVPAAELPPVEKETNEKPVPFWKRDLSFGGGKKEKTPKAAKQPKVKKTKTARIPRMSVERGGKGKKLVGLKIGASQLAAARVTNNGAAELLQVAREPLSPGIVVGGELRDPDALAVALKDFFTKHRLPKRGVRLGIANNRIGVRTFEIGGIDDQKQLDNAIRFRAQEALPIPIDEAVLDYQVLGETTDAEGKPAKRVLLVVAYREQIDRYLDACRKAGIALTGIDLEAFALLRALQAPQSGAGDDPDAALVAVAIGHERSTFAVSDGRVCEFTRVLEWGGQALNVAIARALDAAPSEIESVKRSLSLADEGVPEGLTDERAAKAKDAARKAVQAFARELVSSLQFYQNQPGSLGIGEIVLTGGTAHLPGLAVELERLIGVRVRVGDPLARVKVSKKISEPEQIGSYAVAIGLGIED